MCIRDRHHAAGEFVVLVGGETGNVPRVGREEVVGRFERGEPVERQPGEDAAFVGDGVGNHDVERGDPIRGDDQQPIVVDPVDLTYLPRPEMLQRKHAEQDSPARRTHGLVVRGQ